ncbi:MAG: pentapeptide repeat-containing protein [Fibrobacterales bacterium]
MAKNFDGDLSKELKNIESFNSTFGQGFDFGGNMITGIFKRYEWPDGKYEGLKFEGATFTAIDFDNKMSITHSVFKNCTFSKCNWSRSTWENNTFIGCTFKGHVIGIGSEVNDNEFSKVEFNDSKFYNENGMGSPTITIEGNNWKGSTFNNNEISYFEFKNETFIDCVFKGNSFKNAYIDTFDAVRPQFVSNKYEEFDLSDGTMDHPYLEGIPYVDINYKKFNFSQVVITDTLTIVPTEIVGQPTYGIGGFSLSGTTIDLSKLKGNNFSFTGGSDVLISDYNDPSNSLVLTSLSNSTVKNIKCDALEIAVSPISNVVFENLELKYGIVMKYGGSLENVVFRNVTMGKGVVFDEAKLKNVTWENVTLTDNPKHVWVKNSTFDTLPPFLEGRKFTDTDDSVFVDGKQFLGDK